MEKNSVSFENNISKENKKKSILEKIKKSDLVKNKHLVLLCLPGVLFFLIFAYLPMIGLIIAFQDFNPIKGITGSKFIGFDNFKFFFGSKDFFTVTFNTLFLNILFIGTGTLAAIIIAIILSEIKSKWFKKITQSLIILPHFLSWSVVALLSVALFSTDSGMINNIIRSFGGEPISFYTDASVWPLLLVFIKLWQGAGFGSIIYLATISGIDQQLYEAAKIDGASKFQSILHITLPLLKPTAILLLIMSVGKIFYGDFGMIYALVGSNTFLFPTTDVIDTYVYRQLMELGDIGMSSAVGLYQSLIGFVLVMATNAIAKKFAPDSAIF